MKTRAEAIAVCADLPFVYEDYPFDDDNWTLMRHKENSRTFALIFEREGKIWVNLKVLPENGFIMRELYPSVLPAYHMNKRNWVSVILDGSIPDETVKGFIGESYRLTAKKRKKSAE